MNNKIKVKHTHDKIINAVNAYIKDDAENNRVFRYLNDALKKYDGKQPSKHIEKHVNKELENTKYTVRYFKKLSWFVLEVTGENFKKEYTLCYDSDSCITLIDGKETRSNGYIVGRSFSELNAWASYAAIERIEKNQKFLKDGAISRLAENIVKFHDAFDALKDDQYDSYEVPAMYEVFQRTGISEKLK